MSACHPQSDIRTLPGRDYKRTGSIRSHRTKTALTGNALNFGRSPLALYYLKADNPLSLMAAGGTAEKGWKADIKTLKLVALSLTHSAAVIELLSHLVRCVLEIHEC